MSSYHNQAIAYRPEIDGLRAIAVLPVILFHAGFELFSGGYVGVDVFFVISGYLITSIILREMEHGKFSLVRFYERRARRILPALFFVIACCLPFAWMWMLPNELKLFGQSLVAVATFSSNIYFWRTTDYFAPASEEQPLLHTWSLAVEEQYYVLFPLFLMLCWRFGKTKIFWLTAFIASCSLLLAEWGWRNSPVASFYLLPTRAWELFVGSLVAFIPENLAERVKSHKTAPAGELFGALLIFYSIIFFDRNTPFPSVYSIAPVLGAALLIFYTKKSSVVGNMLASKPLVGIGLISYSAYLWHQPVLVFLRFIFPSVSKYIMIIVALSLVLALSMLTWYFIERRFRVTGEGRASKAIYVSVFVLSYGFFVGFFLDKSNGAPSRLPPEALSLSEKYKNYRDFSWRPGECYIISAYNSKKEFDEICFKEGEDEVILVGDSHAAHLYPGLISFFGSDKVTQLTVTGCSYLENSVSTTSERCKNLNPLRRDYIRKNRNSEIFIAEKWEGDILIKGSVENLRFEELLRSEVSTRGGKVTLVGCAPHWRPELPGTFLRQDLSFLGFYGVKSEIHPSRGIYNPDHDKRRECNLVLSELAEKLQINFINPWAVFCDENSVCLASLPRSLPKEGGQVDLTAFDYGHLTKEASIYLFRNILEEEKSHKY